MNEPMFAVLYGNPLDGMKALGPFLDAESATKAAEREVEDSWWIVTLEAPDAEHDPMPIIFRAAACFLHSEDPEDLSLADLADALGVNPDDVAALG